MIWGWEEYGLKPVISQSFMHCVPAWEKNWNLIFPFENPMSSVSRELADLKALREFNLIYYTHVWLLLRVYSILADQALHDCIKNWKMKDLYRIEIFQLYGFQSHFFALQKDILISKQEEDAHRPFLSSSTYNIYYFCFAIIFVRIHIAKSYYY